MTGVSEIRRYVGGWVLILESTPYIFAIVALRSGIIRGVLLISSLVKKKPLI